MPRNIKRFIDYAPELLLREWDHEKNKEIADIDTIALYAGVKVWWKCSRCGHEWIAVLANRSRGTGCPVCARQCRNSKQSIRKLSLTYNLSVTHPQVAQEWDYDKNGTLRPWDVLPGSHKKVWWKCPVCTYSWNARILSRTEGRGCPCCARTVRVPGINDLATQYPELLLEWNYEKNAELSPDNIRAHRVWWKCRECGHEWQALIYNRTTLGQGCPKCGAHRSALKHRKPVRCVETGEIFASYTKAAEFVGCSTVAIVQCVSGRSRTCGGFHWKPLSWDVQDSDDI